MKYIPLKNKIKKLQASSSKLAAAEKGFTLVETLIAILLFSVAITGVITAANVGGMNIYAARDQVTAHYLAEEGIELMRAKRDSSVISAKGPDIGWADFVGVTAANCGTGFCDIDITNPALPYTATCSTNCAPLKYDATDGYYNHAAGTPSIFTRKLQMTAVNSTIPGDEIKITSTVEWQQGSITRSYTLAENLYDWYNTN